MMHEVEKDGTETGDGDVFMRNEWMDVVVRAESRK